MTDSAKQGTFWGWMGTLPDNEEVGILQAWNAGAANERAKYERLLAAAEELARDVFWVEDGAPVPYEKYEALETAVAEIGGDGD